jgi:hypothetical protein
LVATLGVIVASAITLFGIRSLSAMPIAPVVGAILGFAIGVVTLRLRGLPLSATLEEYRAAAGFGSIEDFCTFVMKVALNAGVVVSIVELPAVLIGETAALSILPAGWIVIIAYALYRAWQINDPRTSNIDLDVFQITGCVALLVISGFVLLFPLFSGTPHAHFSDLDLVKVIFITNAFAALPAVAITVFGLYLFCRIVEMIAPQRY